MNTNNIYDSKNPYAGGVSLKKQSTTTSKKAPLKRKSVHEPIEIIQEKYPDHFHDDAIEKALRIDGKEHIN